MACFGPSYDHLLYLVTSFAVFFYVLMPLLFMLGNPFFDLQILIVTVHRQMDQMQGNHLGHKSKIQYKEDLHVSFFYA